MDELTLLREMLEIYSPSGQEGELAVYLLRRMKELGFHTHQDRAGNVIGVMGEGGKEILLLGHMDTVGGFIPIRLEGGQLYGRGAVDAKGPLAAFILAVARTGPLPGRRIVVAGVVEEEASSLGARSLLDQFSPHYVIIGEPSGWEGVTLGYKGRLLVRYRLTAPMQHSSAQGPSPAEQAVAFWNRLLDYADEVNQEERWRFNTLDPSLRRITSTQGEFEEKVSMDITLRLPLRLDVPVLKERIREWAEGAAVGFAGEDTPFKAEKNTPLVRAFLRAIRAQGGNPTFKLKLGTSDMNTVGPVWGCPIVAYGPGDSALDHTPAEHVEVEEYRRAIEVL
ncbi:MAG: [LysW]-lysine hydrolase, partial [Anaerolineae bacterium]